MLFPFFPRLLKLKYLLETTQRPFTPLFVFEQGEQGLNEIAIEEFEGRDKAYDFLEECEGKRNEGCLIFGID